MHCILTEEQILHRAERDLALCLENQKDLMQRLKSSTNPTSRSGAAGITGRRGGSTHEDYRHHDDTEGSDTPSHYMDNSEDNQEDNQEDHEEQREDGREDEREDGGEWEENEDTLHMDEMEDNSQVNEQKNKKKKKKSRIMLTGNAAFDKQVLHEHELYKGSGSIEAQARIDTFILPCIMYMMYPDAHQPMKQQSNSKCTPSMNALKQPQPTHPTPTSKCIPSTNISSLSTQKLPTGVWEMLSCPTAMQHVTQYGTMPDLGNFIRERMLSQSIIVPTFVQHHSNASFSPSSPSPNSASPFSAFADDNNEEDQMSLDTHLNQQGQGQQHPRQTSSASTSSARHSAQTAAACSGKGVLPNVTALMHICCMFNSPHQSQPHPAKNGKSANGGGNHHHHHHHHNSTAMLHGEGISIALPTCCGKDGCFHGSLIALMIGSVMPLCKKGFYCRRIQPCSMQYRSAVHCCTIMEFTTVCMLLHGLLLGLYPRGSKTAIFDVRVRLVARLRHLLTFENYTKQRTKFLMQNCGLVQLAFLEYVNNVLPDYMPCEMHALSIEQKTIASSSAACDQFREKCIHKGNEPWAQLNACAVQQLDKLIRNMRAVSSSSSSSSTFTSASASASMQMMNMQVPTSTLLQSQALHAKKGAAGYSGATPHAGSSMRKNLLHVNVPQIFSHSLPHQHQSSDALPGNGSSNSHNSGDNRSSSSSFLTPNYPATKTMRMPLPEDMYDLHVCKSNNLAQLYAFEPELQKHRARIMQTHLMHQRVHICMLPRCIAQEQMKAIESQYSTCLIQQASARTMYICTSCAVAGKPIPLRPPMRYSYEKQQFYCLTCHASSTSSSSLASSATSTKTKQEGKDPTSIVAIDMVGKVVHTSQDLSASLCRCYVLCIKCARIHEWQVLFSPLSYLSYLSPFSHPWGVGKYKTYLFMRTCFGRMG